jgi:DNA invertase Pin-like site-specific DNA recombinase
MASLIGYARVSSTDQSTAVQVACLKEARCHVVRREKATGRTRDGRTELAIILDFIRWGHVGGRQARPPRPQHTGCAEPGS